jgi:hypothetical protein
MVFVRSNGYFLYCRAACCYAAAEVRLLAVLARGIHPERDSADKDDQK